MKYHTAYTFMWWRIAGAISFTCNLSRMGLGGGMVIDPTGDHPNIFANLFCAFFLITFNVRLCAHALEHE
jgi:hypothetical protein